MLLGQHNIKNKRHQTKRGLGYSIDPGEMISLIQKEMQSTRKVFVDAMFKMKEKLDDILIGVVDKIETIIAAKNEDHAEKLKQQDDRTLKLEEASDHSERVNILEEQLQESIRQEKNLKRRVIENEAHVRKKQLDIFRYSRGGGKNL